MLRVTVEIVPYGHEENKTVLGTVYISNTLEVEAGQHKYKAYLDKDPRKVEAAPDVVLLHDRTKGWAPLVSRAIEPLKPQHVTTFMPFDQWARLVGDLSPKPKRRKPSAKRNGKRRAKGSR